MDGRAAPLGKKLPWEASPLKRTGRLAHAGVGARSSRQRSPVFHRSAAPMPPGQGQRFRRDELADIRLFRNATPSVIAFASQTQVNTDGAPDG